MSLLIAIGMAAIVCLQSCSSDEGSAKEPATVPVVSTTEVYNITFTTAEVSGTIVSNGGAPITSSGFCWGTEPSPTLAANKSTEGSQTGNFRTNMANLTEGATYYVRAFATNSAGTAYGNEKTFETQLSCQTMVARHPGYEVWAGDTPYFQLANNGDYFYSIDKHGYTKIGESTVTKSFNTGSYKYYVIVSRYWNCVDAIQFNDGSYYMHGQGYTLCTGLTELAKIEGAPDGVFGKFGDKTICPPQGKATYNAFITDDATILSRGGGLKVIAGSGCQ